MKRKTGLLSILMAMVLCVGLLSACSDDTSTNSGDSQSGNNSSNIVSNTDDSTDDNGSDESELSSDVIGKITSVDSSYILIDIYEANAEITDYTSLDGVALTDALSSDTVTLEIDAVFKYVSSGTLYATTIDGLSVGDMIAVTTDEDGLQQIIVLEYSTDSDSSDSSADDNAADSEDSSTDDTEAE